MFEVDYTWGFAANAVQPNQGGGLGAGQVNIQTKGAYVALFPTGEAEELMILVGTHPVLRFHLQPSRHAAVRTRTQRVQAQLDEHGCQRHLGVRQICQLSREGSHCPAHGRAALEGARERSGLCVCLPHRPGCRHCDPAGHNVGLTYWHLQDDTEGQGFAVEGLIRSGPSLIGLPNYNGNTPMNILRPTGYVHYAGLDFHHNLRFFTGPFSASGFVMLNLGEYTAKDERSPNARIEIRGFAANLEGDYNYGKTPDDLVTLEMMLTNGDSDPTDAVQRGPFTLNNYGLTSAIWFNHRTLLLFPFTAVATNFTGAVPDVQNQGYGLFAVVGSASRDLIPYKLSLKLGAAFGMTFAEPPDLTDSAEPGRSLGARGRVVGTELNVELKYRIRYTMIVGLHTAVMFKGNFYRGDRYVSENPWAAFTTFTWYVL